MAKIHHVVLLRFKPETSSATLDAMSKALVDLKGKVPGILDVSSGPYASSEGLNQGFTYGLMVTFADAASRDGYLQHPDHEVVKQMILDELDGEFDRVVAFDWQAPGA